MQKYIGDDEINVAIERQRWIAEQALAFAGQLIAARPGLSVAQALAEAEAAILSLLQSKRLLSFAAILPCDEAVALLLRQQLADRRQS